MTRYFTEAFQRASGGYLVTARQVFYVLRELINQRHGKELTRSDCHTFTQSVLTEIFEAHPEVEGSVLLEHRGFSKIPFPVRSCHWVRKMLTIILTRRSLTESIPRLKSFIQYLSITGSIMFFLLKRIVFNNILEQSGFTEKEKLGGNGYPGVLQPVKR